MTAVIILAAGEGKRMANSRPKVLHKLANLTLLEHSIYQAKKILADEIVIVTSPQLQKILPQYNTVVQDPPLGTADALRVGLSGLSNLDQNVVVLCADTLVSSADVTALLQISDTAMLLFDGLKPHSHYGRAIIKNKVIERIVEYKDLKDQEHNVAIGYSGVIKGNGNKLWNALEKIDNNNAAGEYYLTDLPLIIKNIHPLIGNPPIGINSLTELAQAEHLWQQKKRQKLLKNGVQLIAPETVYCSYDTQIEEGSIVYPNVFFGPKVEIGKHCIIYPNTVITHSKIGAFSQIGPFAHIRDDTNIGEHVAVGNFVEIKASNLSDNVKAKHHSYLGNSQLAKNVNIGAGTITCNYDGKNKHNTTIGANTFVGANTSLVAPIVIGEDVLVAAGSVLTQDVADKSFTIARARQVIKMHKNEKE